MRNSKFQLCKDVLTSVALNYTAMHLSAAVEAVRQSKLLQEEQDQEDMDTTVRQSHILWLLLHINVNPVFQTTQGESMTIDQKVYSPGDFVYYEQADNKSKNYFVSYFYNDNFKINEIIFSPWNCLYWTSMDKQRQHSNDVRERVFTSAWDVSCCIKKILRAGNLSISPRPSCRIYIVFFHFLFRKYSKVINT